MARINEAHERLKKKYESTNDNQNSATSTSNTNDIGMLRCEDCSGNGKFWIIPENYQVIKYINFFTNETNYVGGKLFIKWPWKTHIEILDKRAAQINPRIKNYKTQDGDTASADFSLEYEIINESKFIENCKNFEKKVNDRIASSMQTYFRNHDAHYIATHPIDYKTFDRDGYDQLQIDFGIHITVFNTTTIELTNYDKEKNKRQQQLMQIETQQATLQGKKDIQELQREVSKFAAETDNQILKARIDAIQEKLGNFSQEQQAYLLKSILEIIEISKNSTNINYFAGAGIDTIFDSLNNGKKK